MGNFYLPFHYLLEVAPSLGSFLVDDWIFETRMLALGQVSGAEWILKIVATSAMSMEISNLTTPSMICASIYDMLCCAKAIWKNVQTMY